MTIMTDQANAVPAQQSDLVRLLDGKKIPGQLRATEEGKAPQDIELFVRKIPICDMETLGRVWGKYKMEVAVYVDRDVNFAQSLSDETFGAVLEEGRRLNFTSFEKWFSWQQETLRAMGEGSDAQALVQQVLEKVAANAAKEKPTSASA